MAEATIAGISDNQLAALIRGGWEDGDISNTPGWKRWVTAGNEDEDGVEQLVWPSVSEWKGSVEFKENTRTDTLEDALAWCDNRVGIGEIRPPVGTATKQENRFYCMQTGPLTTEFRSGRVLF